MFGTDVWPDDFYTPQKGQKVGVVCMYDRRGGKRMENTEYVLPCSLSISLSFPPPHFLFSPFFLSPSLSPPSPLPLPLPSLSLSPPSTLPLLPLPSLHPHSSLSPLPPRSISPGQYPTVQRDALPIGSVTTTVTRPAITLPVTGMRGTVRMPLVQAGNLATPGTVQTEVHDQEHGCVR